MLPFTEAIPRVEEKLLAFLVENKAYYQLSESGSAQYPTEVVEQCLDPADRVVMDEFILQLLFGLRLQYLAHDEIYRYQVREEFARVNQGSCQSVEAFFWWVASCQ